MGRAIRRSFSPKLKFQVVLEALKGHRTPGQIAKAYGVHPNSIGRWKTAVVERGPEIFAREQAVEAYERRIAELERLLGQKEVEIALVKTSWGRAVELGRENPAGARRGTRLRAASGVGGPRPGAFDVGLPSRRPRELRSEVPAPAGAARGHCPVVPGVRLPSRDHGAARDVWRTPHREARAPRGCIVHHDQDPVFTGYAAGQADAAGVRSLALRGALSTT